MGDPVRIARLREAELVNAAAWLAASTTNLDRANQRAALEAILPVVPRDSARIGQIADACDHALAVLSSGADGSSGWTRAMLDLSNALSAYFKRRLAETIAAREAEEARDG